MNIGMTIEILIQAMVGLGIFMYGMKQMSTGMQKLAGERLKTFLAVLTSNRFVAVIVGIMVTAFVQSSSVSTVMTIGFVNAGLMSLKQALGVILGANIGTTVTGWILVLKIGKYGLPIAGLGGLINVFVPSEKWKVRATTLMGFGFIFYGLELMSAGFKPLRTMPEFIRLFHSFQADSFGGILMAASIGMLLTAVLQSSSATLGITITLATQGLINYPTAVALVIGENVGTTVTACLASIGAKANAKRAAYAHTIVNIVGVLWVVTLFSLYLKLLALILSLTTGADSTTIAHIIKGADLGTLTTDLHGTTHAEHVLTQGIATAHTLFNLINVLIFVPLLGPLTNLLNKLVKDDEGEKAEKLIKIDPRMTDTPTFVIEQTKNEIINMGEDINKLFKEVGCLINSPKDYLKKIERIKRYEERFDIMSKELADINYQIMTKGLSEKEIEETRKNIEVASEYETISDYLTRVAKVLDKLKTNGIELNGRKIIDLNELHKEVHEMFMMINNGYGDIGKKLIFEEAKKATLIKEKYKDARRSHMKRIGDKKMEPLLSTAYMDILNHYRRMKDHMETLVDVIK